MSRPGSELFPETSPAQYNSYDVASPIVEDYLDSGVKQPEVAAPAQMSDKEMNFRALREEASKLKAESEYWRGQAEAFSRSQREPEVQQQDAYAALDWDDSRDIQKAFTQLRHENESLKGEIRDQLAAVNAKSQYQDWDNLVHQHVPQLTSKNPMFAEMIRNASNPYEAAYLLAQLNDKAAQRLPAHETSNGDRAIANAKKPGSPSSIGGRGQLSAADYYATMSDDDFMKIAARNLAAI